MVWNKGIKGYKCYHKKLDNVDWKLACYKILLGCSINKLQNDFGVCGTTIRKYLLQSYPELQYIIYKNSLNAKIKSNYVNGQAALYRKLLLEVIAGLHSCEVCCAKNNIHIHHKKKIIYINGRCKAKNFNNNSDNIIFLCNSCHQKLHYRKLGRKHKVKHCIKTGRFLKNE